LIRQGATETQVEVIYRSFDRVYRILRSRSLGGAGTLEWQIQTKGGWRSLTRKGMRATQQAIQIQLRLDYATFINSAYLRQGRADEFTLKRPSDRKRLLAEMLDLGRYDSLAERCRERVRTAKGQVEVYQQQRQQQQEQLQHRSHLQSEWEELVAEQAQLESLQAEARSQLEAAEERERNLRLTQQQVEWGQQQLATLKSALQQTEVQWRQQQQRRQHSLDLVSRSDDIERGYGQYQQLAREDEQQQQQGQQRQQLLQHQQKLRHQLLEQQHRQSLERQKRQAQLEQLAGAKAADEALVADGDRITDALAHYRRAQAELTRLDRLQIKAAPLMAQQQVLHQQLSRDRERLLARREALQQQMQQEGDRSGEGMRQAVLEVETKLDELTKLRVYQQRVLEKGQERRAFVEQLQERQRSLQRQWQMLDERCRQLDSPEQTCPLCDQPLDGDRRTAVLDKQRTQQEDYAEQIWVIREQLAVADREIELMRQEYSDLTAQLHAFDTYLERQGRLQQQLEANVERDRQFHTWQAELTDLDSTLESGDYAASLQTQLADINAALAELGYDDKDRALARSDVDRWRWAALKYGEWKKARQRLAHTQAAIAELQAELQALDTADTSPNRAIATLTKQLNDLDRQLDRLSYDEAAQRQLRQRLGQLHTWHSQWEALQQARSQLPDCDAACASLKQLLQQHRQAFGACQRQLDAALQQQHLLAQTAPPENFPSVKDLKAAIASRRQVLDRVLSQQGATRQRLAQLQELEAASQTTDKNLQQARRQLQVHRELARAYGANGIPALVIETALPELEAEANRILGQLTEHQLHLQFVTQRSGRQKDTLIDTLDILIADPRGTRPYETYSGGEAFRINFAIRLALSRLLAQRSGASLQTLLIDEGFGSQDRAGREHLVAAIDAVAPDFACILAITHIPSLRDRFPSRIQVERHPDGSRLQVLS
jgi:exonuclease SbcC